MKPGPSSASSADRLRRASGSVTSCARRLPALAVDASPRSRHSTLFVSSRTRRMRSSRTSGASRAGHELTSHGPRAALGGLEAMDETYRTDVTLLRPCDVVKMLGVSRSWLYDAAKSGRIPCVRLGGDDGPVRFRPDDVEAWLEASRLVPAAGATRPSISADGQRAPQRRRSAHPQRAPSAAGEQLGLLPAPDA